MCGIFGFASFKKQPSKIVLEGLKRLEYRGYDSWGIAVENNEKILCDRHTGKIGQAKTNLPSSQIGLGHTRWATHGGVTKANSHPQLDCRKKIAVVHNGIIENYDTLKKKLKDHTFVSQTDTEVVPHLIEKYLSKYSFSESIRKSFQLLQGLNAIIAIDIKQNKLFAAKTGSPLILGFGKGQNFIASDAACLLAHTDLVYYLEDGQMAEISASQIIVRNIKTNKKLIVKKHKLSWKFKETKKGKYDHFMIKEIMDQPQVIRSILINNSAQLKKLSAVIKRSLGTSMVACGTGAYAALSGTYIFSKIAKKHINYMVGSEFGYTTDFLNKKSLVIALSQSGETIDIIESVKKAKEKGAKIVALVNVLGSTLYRLADYKILLNAGPEKAVASTKAFTAKLANLILLSYCFNPNPKKGKVLLNQAIKETQRLLKPKSLADFKKLASKIFKQNHLYVIGRGLSYPIALETALKIKEVSYIHAEGFAAGELKHGTIALIQKNTPCIAFLPNDETYGATLAGAMEIKSRGGYIIGISHKPHEIIDYFIKVKDCKVATAIPNVVTAQLLAYFLSVKKGIDPDKPRNLAKSVTVK